MTAVAPGPALADADPLLAPTHPPFRLLDGETRIARVLLVAVTVIAAGSVVADVAQYVFVDAMLANPRSGDAVDRLVVSDLWQALLALLMFLIGVPTAIAFIVWLQRSYLNLASLGHEQLRFSPGGVVGAWFVPGLNLVWPKMVVDATWRGSDPDAPELAVLPDDRGTVPFSIHLWWGCFIAMGVCWFVGFYLTSDDLISPTRERLAYALEITSSAAAVAAAVLAYGLVGAVNMRQRQRAARLGIDPVTGYRPVPTVVQPVVDQPQVAGFPPPPSVPPMSVRPPDDLWFPEAGPPPGLPPPPPAW
jgi:hypothetical protein